MSKTMFKPGDRITVMGYARLVVRGNENHPEELVHARCFDGTQVIVLDETLVALTFKHGVDEWEIYKNACAHVQN